MMRRKVEEEEEARGRGSQMGCHAPGRSYCIHLQPGSLIHHWTDSHFPGEEERSLVFLNHMYVSCECSGQQRSQLL